MSLTPWISSIVFYIFAIITIVAAFMVAFSRLTMRSILALMVCFVAVAVLWLLLQAEFLALVLVFVYVGAVMTLFLFVVMMLDLEPATPKEGFVRYLPYAGLLMLALLSVLIFVYLPEQFPLNHLTVIQHPADYSNTGELGLLLYTHYILSFELAGAILLVAIIAAISLAFSGRKKNTRFQRIEEQLKANKADRLFMISDDKLQGKDKS